MVSGKVGFLQILNILHQQFKFMYYKVAEPFLFFTDRKAFTRSNGSKLFPKGIIEPDYNYFSIKNLFFNSVKLGEF